MRTLGHYAAGHDNNFNLLRMLAATAVIYSHSFPFLQGYVPQGWPNWHGDWLFDLTDIDSGRMAVEVFFVMSGFLVGQSLDRRGLLKDYFVARALRILPGLYAAVLFCAFGVGLVMTTLPAREYLLSLKLLKYLVFNFSLLHGWDQMLPGVFSHNPEGGRVNNSLWTLTWEVLMYLLLALAFVGGLLRRRAILLALTLAVYAFVAINRETHAVSQPYVQVVTIFFSYFFVGTLLWLYRDRIPLNGWTTLAALAGVALCWMAYKDHAQARALSPALEAYAVIALALVPAGPLRLYNRLGDYSYGTYIYAFPLEQSLVVLLPGLTPHRLFAYALALTLPFAWASWTFIEKPALALKPRRRKPA